MREPVQGSVSLWGGPGELAFTSPFTTAGIQRWLGRMTCALVAPSEPWLSDPQISQVRAAGISAAEAYATLRGWKWHDGFLG